MLAALTMGCAGDARPGAVHVLTADTQVDSILARYIERGIERAEDQRAAAVVVRIDTPGGELGAMRRAVRHIENARVPVITFVGPAGAQAASAGTFIAMAGHVAAMAPSTTIGAATPISITGEDVEGALGRKVTNDTAAFARGVAELHGRNANWAEQAVRDAVSATASEAVALRVVDYTADGLDSLLSQAEGRRVRLAGGVEATIKVRDAPRVSNSQNAYERVLRILSDPVIVSLLLLVGIGLILWELHAPGLWVPGAIGVVAFLGALVGLGTLLPEEAAIALIVAGIVMIALEVFIPGGVVGSIGAVALLIGLGALLGRASTELDWQLALTLAAIVVVAVGVLIGGAYVLLARRYMASTERTGTARL